MAVSDRWHKTRPAPDEPKCAEHRRVPTADHGDGDQWQVRWRDDIGAQRKRFFAKKSAATSFDAEIRSQLDKGTSLDLAAGKQKVSVYAAARLESLAVRPATAERLERVFRLHLAELALGKMSMASVRQSHVRAWLRDRSAVLAPGTLAAVWSDLASMFSAAVADRVIGVSPCTGVRLPAAARPARYVPVGTMVQAVIAELPERYRAIGWLAAGCGWRRNEILGAELDAIDFLRRTAEVRQQLLALGGQPMYLAEPKTPTSYRVNELPQVASLALARHIELFPPEPRPIMDRTNPRKPFERLATLLFTTQSGAPVHPAWWAAVWRDAADRAGIPKGVGIHSFRHYFATLLITKGRTVKEVQLALGHKNPTITLNTYAGWWPEEAGSTRSIVDDALGDVPRACLDHERGAR